MAPQTEDDANIQEDLRNMRLSLMMRAHEQPKTSSQLDVVEPRPAVHLAGGLSGGSQLHTSRKDAISSEMFYGEYHGHLPYHLSEVVERLRAGSSNRSVIWLCGDSSLDNKYWLPEQERRDAINGYEQVLVPPQMVPDVAYWLNSECVQRGIGDRFCAVNTSVEESTLADRSGHALLVQDAFIRDHIQQQDVLVVSVGGNDVALRPTVSTIASIAGVLLSPRWLIRRHWAPGFQHFINMFQHETRRLIEKVTSVQRPKYVVVCMYYYFDERAGGSWADYVLSMLGYDRDPSKLQLVMREVFAGATENVSLEGVKVIPLPLCTVLDGKNPADYEQRVEPSVQGGRKMAVAMMDSIVAALAL